MNFWNCRSRIKPKANGKANETTKRRHGADLAKRELFSSTKVAKDLLTAAAYCWSFSQASIVSWSKRSSQWFAGSARKEQRAKHRKVCSSSRSRQNKNEWCFSRSLHTPHGRGKIYTEHKIERRSVASRGFGSRGVPFNDVRCCEWRIPNVCVRAVLLALSQKTLMKRVRMVFKTQKCFPNIQPHGCGGVCVSFAKESPRGDRPCYGENVTLTL